MFPSSLITKLFVRGSLKNTADGFEFKIKNIIDSGTIIGLGALTIDDMTYEPSSLTITFPAKELTGDQVTRENPVYARMMMEIMIRVHGAPLETGQHKITLPIQTREAGKIQFSITEPLSN